MYIGLGGSKHLRAGCDGQPKDGSRPVDRMVCVMECSTGPSRSHLGMAVLFARWW